MEITPKAMQCLMGACPRIYEGLRELTPEEMQCVFAACPSLYEAGREGNNVYLIIGKVVNPSEVALLGDLKKKIRAGEALIEVPRELIDNKGKWSFLKCLHFYKN